MKNLKKLADKKYKEFVKLFNKHYSYLPDIESEVIWNKRKHSLEDRVDKIKHIYKLFDPVWEAEKSYLKARLDYINSQEYAKGEYKNDVKKYEKIIVKIDKTLGEIKKKYLKKNECILIGGSKKNGIPTSDMDYPKTFIKSFNNLKRLYGKKPGSYNLSDIKILCADHSLGRDVAGQKIITLSEYDKRN